MAACAMAFVELVPGEWVQMLYTNQQPIYEILKKEAFTQLALCNW
jgi:hypothetical protein